MEEIIMWLYAEGDFLMFLCRTIGFVFALQFVTGIVYVIRGGYNGIS